MPDETTVPPGRAIDVGDEQLGFRYPTRGEIQNAERYAHAASTTLRDLFNAEAEEDASDDV